MSPDRYAWIQVVQGELLVNGTALTTGDGAAIEQEELVSIAASSDSEFLLFDLA